VFAGYNGGNLTNLNVNASLVTSIGNNSGGLFNFFVGPSGNSTLSGTANTGIGFDALNFNSTGSGNTANGYEALFNNGSGSDNTALGARALGNVTTDSGLVAIGYEALQNDAVVGSFLSSGANTAVGYQALQMDTSGSANTALGYQAIMNNNSGFNNTAIGGYALQNLTAGNNNIALGYSAGNSLNSGNNNIYIANLGKASESGIIRIGDPTNQTATYLVGTVSVPVLSITGGSDLAEPFPISTPDTEVAQGAVVVIDDANPGHLKLSDQPYDAHVAGVISGANGIHPGIQMQQQGLLEGGRNVALTGRVYVQADASNGPIEPGDLLTTSSTPGRAMKVTDHVHAQGAILGKAMTSLKDGQGMVLVLVNAAIIAIPTLKRNQ
jgi:hypothetical protein